MSAKTTSEPSPQFHEYSQALKWLFRQRPQNKRTSLRQLLIIAQKLGKPQKKFATVHVAGTNGKGSVSAKIARALTWSGWRVGLFTSPHLHSFCERICVDEQCIAAQEVTSLLNDLFARVPEIDQLHFFDISHFLALIYFCRNAIDIAVIETGVGGRLDATNICRPILTVITAIGEDHRSILGNSLREIAKEKGGIIKRGIPLVLGTGAQNLGIEAIASQRKALLYTAGGVHRDIDRYNCAVAESALKIIGGSFALSSQAIARGLSFRSPGRCEVLEKSAVERWPKALLFDVAHNRQGLEQLTRYISATYPQANVHLVFGLARDKELAPCLEALRPLPVLLYPTSLTGWGARGFEPEVIARVALNCGHRIGSVSHDPRLALRKALEAAEPNELVVACGSFHLIGTLRVAMGLASGDPV